MEDNFNQSDFEEFLQDQVRNHRMYPADAVWREIDKKLHGEKRWPALTVAALMLLSTTVLICVYFTPKPNILSLKPADANTSTPQLSQNNNILNNLTTSESFSKEKRTFSGPIQNALPVASSAISANAANDRASFIIPEIERNSIAVPEPHFKNPGVAKLAIVTNNIAAKQKPIDESVHSNTTTEPVKASEGLAKQSKVAANKAKVMENRSTKDQNDKNMVDDFLKEHKDDISLHTSYKKRSLKNRFSYQVYVAPSISYRKLLEDHSFDEKNSSGPVGLNYVTDVNKVVRHKPGTGIEVGISFMYSLSDKVRVKSGFQFNMREYSIEAYRANTELASIALMTGNRIDTVNTLSFYRNNNGYSSAELVNRYYQLSVPVGVEWTIIGNKRIQLNVAGTIQPTYLLNRNAYLLSTNFKNYTENPEMVRKWNINSNIEAFVSFKVGDFKWQLGPQLRYQPYSTFIPEYTIKEHLMDYGIKLGVSQVIK